MIWLYDYFERPICVKAAELSDEGIRVMLKLREAGFSDDDCYEGARIETLASARKDGNTVSVEEVEKMVKKCPSSQVITRILKGELVSPTDDGDMGGTVKRFLKGELVLVDGKLVEA